MQFPFCEMGCVLVPFLGFHLDIGVGEFGAQGGFEFLVGVEGADGVEEVERQFRRVLDQVAVLVHVDVRARARIGVGADAVEAGGKDHRLHQVRVRGAVGQAQLEAARAGHAHHMGAVVAGPGHRIRRPGRARGGARRVDPLVAVDGRAAQKRQRRGVFHDPAEEGAALIRQAKLFAVVGEGVRLAVGRPDRDMGMAAVAGLADQGLGHEGRAQPVFLGQHPGHELEEGVFVGGGQNVVVFPVHLELAVGVLMVVLIGLPAVHQHGVGDFLDQIVAPQDGVLIVAGLDRIVEFIGHAAPVGPQQEEFGLDPGLDAQAHGRGLGHQFAQHVPRRLVEILAAHHAVRGDPGHFRVPGQLDHGRGIGDRQHVGMRRRHIEPGRETGETGAVLAHALDRLGRRQLGALIPQKIGERDHEVADAALFGIALQLGSGLGFFPDVSFVQGHPLDSLLCRL
ncbi:hypothetical protein XINFAN_00047 [Pseudogemmobacter humi]|uniref:Uncharacterized protein n=1 Tax=Pseudogemmobacter humi TaxID=2483812 RepID=A0A3P5WVQ9_9RHOB|nr:hypothetical protein XINFAN_00047 [Pseudogemmobacter humi]